MTESLRELVSGRLFRLGGEIELDGRVSWLPAGATGSIPVSCYLVKEGSRNVLVDTGIALHEEAVLGQLRQVLRPGETVSVFLTRAEFDAFGNVGRIAEEYQIDALYTGGVSNPFDAFDSVALTGPRQPSVKIEVARQPPGFAVEVGGERKLEILAPGLRILATYWVLDSATRFLFTSDSFGHRQAGTDAIQPDAVREHLLAKFGWLREATVEPVVESLDRIFLDHEIRAIAPGHGWPILGQDAAARHYRALRQAILDAGSAAPVTLRDAAR